MGRKKILFNVRQQEERKAGRETAKKTRVKFARVIMLLMLPAIITFAGSGVLAATGGGVVGSVVPVQAIDKGPAAKLTDPQVILIVLDKITLQDLLRHAGPELTALLNKSAVALMNVNTAATPGTESGYLSIGSGSRLQGNWTARQAYNRDENLQQGTVEGLYRRHTGKAEAPAGEVLHPCHGALHRLNEQRSYPVCVGALGEALSAAGRGVAVLGNADSNTFNRQVVTIAMNKAGAVAYGDVSPALLRDRDDFPFGCGCDSVAYLKAFDSLQGKVSLFVVEWGDTGRLDNYLEHLSTGRRAALLQDSLQEFDLFLGGIKPALKEGTRLLIVTPSIPNAAFTEGQRLTPVACYTPGSEQRGLLVTATTRRPGIVTNIDVAPAVLQYLGLKAPTFFFGTPLEVVPEGGHLKKLQALAERIARVNNQRPAVIKGYILAQVVLLLGGLAGLIYRFKPTGILRPGLEGLLFFPLALLLAPALPFFPARLLYMNIFVLLGLTALLTLGARLFFRKLMPLFTFTGLSVFALLVADLFCGAYLNSRSFLGYDPVGGARFYGLGNEFMGILIGAFILGFGSLFSYVFRNEDFSLLGCRFSNRFGMLSVTWLFIIISVFVLFLLASPLYGANFGGAITAGVALAVTLGGMLTLLRQKGYALTFFKRRAARNTFAPFLYPQKFLLLIVFVLVTAAFLYFLNTADTACRSDAVVSHVGRTWELVRSHGWQELINIAQRKMGMNLKLLRYSLWSRAFFLFIFLITLLYFYPVGLMQQIFKDEPGFKLILGGILAGSLTAFLVNDSGVVAAATTMLYGALPLLLLCFQKVFARSG